MNENDAPKKRSKVDKLVKGIVIGGALGSIIGATISQKKSRKPTDSVDQPAKKPKGMVGTFMRGMKALIRGKKKS